MIKQKKNNKNENQKSKTKLFFNRKKKQLKNKKKKLNSAAAYHKTFTRTYKFLFCETPTTDSGPHSYHGICNSTGTTGSCSNTLKSLQSSFFYIVIIIIFFYDTNQQQFLSNVRINCSNFFFLK